MPQPDHVISLDVKVPETPAEPDLKKYFDKCLEKIGFVPNVIKGYAARPSRWCAFVTMYHAIMDKDASRLSPLEREMIAVVVSAVRTVPPCFRTYAASGSVKLLSPWFRYS